MKESKFNGKLSFQSMQRSQVWGQVSTNLNFLKMRHKKIFSCFWMTHIHIHMKRNHLKHFHLHASSQKHFFKLPKMSFSAHNFFCCPFRLLSNHPTTCTYILMFDQLRCWFDFTFDLNVYTKTNKLQHKHTDHAWKTRSSKSSVESTRKGFYVNSN